MILFVTYDPLGSSSNVLPILYFLPLSRFSPSDPLDLRALSHTLSSIHIDTNIHAHTRLALRVSPPRIYPYFLPLG